MALHTVASFTELAVFGVIFWATGSTALAHDQASPCAVLVKKHELALSYRL